MQDACKNVWQDVYCSINTYYEKLPINREILTNKDL